MSALLTRRNTTHGATAPGRRRAGLGVAAMLCAAPALALLASGAAHAETISPSFSLSGSVLDADGVWQYTTAASSTGRSAWEVISTDPQFTTYAAIVRNAGLESAFQSADAGTVLAPTEYAFKVDDPGATTLTDPAKKGAAVEFVNGLLSRQRHTMTDLLRAVPGAVDPSVQTVTTCAPEYAYDAAGLAFVIGNNNCTTVTTAVGAAAPVTELPLSNGRTVRVHVDTVAGINVTGVRVSIGHAFVFTSITAANGTIDGLDTISV